MLMRIMMIVSLAMAAAMPVGAQYYFTDTAAVNTAYRELIKNPGSEAHFRNYVKAFPRTWQEYVNLYVVPYEVGNRQGFDSTMANLCSGQVSALNYRVKILDGHIELSPYDRKPGEDSTVCAKIVNIAVGIPYGCDQLGYLQSALRDNLRDRRDAMFKTVVNLTEPDQLRFWLLVCASITDKDSLKKELDGIYEAFRARYPVEAKTMRIGYDYAFNRSVLDSDGRGHIGMRKAQPDLWPDE